MQRRKPVYLSPSAISLFEKSKDDYYVRYITPVKQPYDPQSEPMAMGSALDAYAKAAFIKDLKGEDVFDKLFEDSVEIANRDFAREEGKKLFEIYKGYGVYRQLLQELRDSPVEPRFEFELRGTINGVPLLGKPDIFYYTPDIKPVILDFKVNGYMAKNSVTPMPGFLHCHPDGKCHRDAIFSNYGKYKRYNQAKPLNQANTDWARQLSIYAWLCGVNVGDSFLAEIHQFCGNPKLLDSHGFPKPVRVALHSSLVDSAFQQECLNVAVDIWNRINSPDGHFFKELSKEESDARCNLLDQRTVSPESIIDR